MTDKERDKEQNPYDTYNKKRVRLCEFAVTQDVAEDVKPALERLADEYGGKVPALAKIVLDADRKLTAKKNK